MPYVDHSRHSGIVRSFRVKQARNWFDEDIMKWKEAKSCVVRSPHDGFVIQVVFSRYTDHPEYVRIRSTNWRAEHEPGGVYHAKDAEAFYRQLMRAGFVHLTPNPEQKA